MSRRFGVTPCVLAGFEKSRGDAVVCLDADLQDPPELIPDLISKWREGADVVHTTRTARRGENPLKLLLTRAAYWMINRFSDIEILQNTGDFKLLSRRALDELLRLDEFDPFLRGLVSWVGFKQDQVFYVREQRFAGTTKFSLLTTLNPYKEFIRGITLFSTTPLYISLFLGLFVSALSFFFLLVLIGIPLVFERDASLSWNHLLLGTILLMGGMILFTVGILGMYVGRIHRETINRPRYIIREFIGGD
jgi:dolichol-phosphate mannosyltransferase